MTYRINRVIPFGNEPPGRNVIKTLDRITSNAPLPREVDVNEEMLVTHFPSGVSAVVASRRKANNFLHSLTRDQGVPKHCKSKKRF